MAKTLKDILESFDFNRAALAKQRLQNLRHSGRRVRGARIANLMRAAGLKEEEMDETDLDQLDEVLSADATASDWIHDFVHSTNPKFEGKSKKERIKMALGAYYAKARHKDGEGLSEELEEAVRIVDTIRRKFDRNHGKKDGSFQGKMERAHLAAAAKDRRKVTDGSGTAGFNSAMKRKKSDQDTGQVRAVKEETDQMDEGVNKSDVPAYLRKKTGDQLTTKDLEKERTQNRSHPETIKKINGTVQEGLGSTISSVFQKMKSRLKPSTQPTSAPTAPTTPKKPNPVLAQRAKDRDTAQKKAALQKYGTRLSATTKSNAENGTGDGHSYGSHVNPTTGTKNQYRMTPQGKYQHHDSETKTWNDLSHKDDVEVARGAVKSAAKAASAERTGWKSRNESVEHLDELSVGSLKSYIKAAKASKKFEADTQNTAMRKDDHMMASDAAQVVAKRKEGIKTAKAKLNKEEKDTVVKDKEGKVVSWKHEGDWKKSTAKKNPEGKVHNLAGMALKKTKSMTNEEVELTEAVKTTHEDPLVTVHDKHGLHTHANLSTANHIFNTKVKHTDVHAGPVKTKDGHETKRDLTFAISQHHEIEMKKEEFEQFINQLQLDEEIVEYVLEAAKQYAGLEKEDKPGKVKTAVVKLHQNGVESETVEGWKDEKKPVKEEFDEEGNLITTPKTFQQFMEGMTATQVRPGVTRYTGGSYGSAKGAKYGNTDYDSEDIDKKEDESQEQQKRGRGRPAGSKSGARGPRIK